VHGNQFGRIKEEGNKKNKNRRKQKNKKRFAVCQIKAGFAVCPRSGTRQSELQIS
jgi:hypothetical protein